MSETTIPRTSDTAASTDVPRWALVLCQSFARPDRIGEVAFFELGDVLYVGRGDAEIEKFPPFWRHRPGESAPKPSREGCLSGNCISRRLLRMRATAVCFEMTIVSETNTVFVNGEKVAGRDTVRLTGSKTLMAPKRSSFAFSSVPAEGWTILELGECRAHSFHCVSFHGSTTATPMPRK